MFFITNLTKVYNFVVNIQKPSCWTGIHTGEQWAKDWGAIPRSILPIRNKFIQIINIKKFKELKKYIILSNYLFNYITMYNTVHNI